MALGALLLTAGALKTYGLSVSPLPSVGGLSVPAVQYSVVTWEFVLGSLLVLGAFRPLPWILAIGTFFAFAVVSGYLGMIGQASCGCFGAIKASPWAAVDVVAVAALSIARPNRDEWQIATMKPLLLRTAVLLGGALASFAIIALGCTLFFGSISATLATLQGESLSAPSYVNFGSAKPGDYLERTITIKNWTAKPVRLIGGTSDCSCITTSEMPLTIPSGESLTLTIKLAVPESNAGAFTRIASIWTDCDQQRTIPLRLGCQVE